MSKEKKIPSNMYKKIRQYIEASFMKDYRMINTDFPFFNQMKPRVRYEIVTELFYDFNKIFGWIFFKDGFKADKEFIAQFQANLYCRIYIPL